jgi:hypothetical protein
VITYLEDTEDDRGFEAAIISGYNAETAVERELVLRISSLLWRAPDHCNRDRFVSDSGRNLA